MAPKCGVKCGQTPVLVENFSKAEKNLKIFEKVSFSNTF